MEGGGFFCCESNDLLFSEESTIWVFPKIGVPQNGWFIMENLIKMEDLEVPLFSETSIRRMLEIQYPWM